MQIVICDDLIAERQILRSHIYRCGGALSLDYAIEEFDSAEALLCTVRGGKLWPDVLFMDIYMDGMSGIEAAKLLKAEGFYGALIFTTTSESHAIESYNIMAEGYLVKPYSNESFDRNFHRVVQHYKDSFKTLNFPCDRLEFQVFLKDLEYIESNGRGSVVYAKGKTLHTSKPISVFAQELAQEENFLRTHQGCIVNLHFVAKVQTDYIQMRNGAKAPLALRSRKSILKTATDYFFLKMREDG